MIRFRHMRLVEGRQFGPMPVPAGTKACMVYSTATGAGAAEKELIVWAKGHNMPRHWLRHLSTTGWPYLEVWGSALEECGEGIDGRRLVEDARAWAVADAMACTR